MAHTQTIMLSDGEPFKVRRLGLFELDNLTPDPLGPFTYKMEVLGKTYDTIFDPDRYDEPPAAPDTPEHEIEENSDEWYQLVDYRLYQAALAHRAKVRKQTSAFFVEVATHILNEACLDDPRRIQEPADWQAVYYAALVPPLTIEKLSTVLHKTYAAEFGGEDIFTALEGIATDKGSYNTIKVWENKLMIDMQMTEVEYAMMDVDERARKVCAMILPDIMSSLRMADQRRQTGGQSKTNNKGQPESYQADY